LRGRPLAFDQVGLIRRGEKKKRNILPKKKIPYTGPQERPPSAEAKKKKGNFVPSMEKVNSRPARKKKETTRKMGGGGGFVVRGEKTKKKKLGI